MTLIAKFLGLLLNLLSFIAPKAAGRSAFRLFCTPFAAKLKPHQADFLSSANQKTIQFEGKKLQLYQWGTGSKTLLLVHGWQSNTFRWKKLIEALDFSEYTLHAFDAPAHGQSEGRIMNVPIYARALQQVFHEIGDVHALIGHSIGCFATMYMCYTEPTIRPSRAVFMASPGNAEEFFGYFRDLVGISARTERLTREYFIDYIGKAVEFFDTRTFGPSMGIPGLIIHDRDDVEVPIIHAENLHTVWLQSDLLITEKLGHSMKSPMVIDAILDYIKE